MVIAKTPLRISFSGGGSDIQSFYSRSQGQVVSATIDKYVYVIIKKRFDDKIYINYSKKECVDDVGLIQHDLVRESMVKTNITSGVEITTLADIPSSGSGLGSSSSITVGLLHALYTFKNKLVSADKLAEEACEIEIDILGNPIGKQDQYAAAFGGLNHFKFNKDQTVERKPINLDQDLLRRFSSSIFLYYTGIARSSETILKDQIKLKSEDQKFNIMRKIVNMVPEFINFLKSGDIINCGILMDKNWELKKKMAKGITNDKIDDLYQFAKDAGSIGGKISGAGGGGFLLMLTERDSQSQFFKSMSNLKQLPFNIENIGSRVIFDHRSNSSY